MDILSTSGINSLVSSYSRTESQKYITPLNTKKSKYQNISNAYSDIKTKLNSLVSVLDNLKSTGTDSLFTAKAAASSNSSVVTAEATSAASVGSFAFNVSQLAKSDIAVSTNLTASDANAITGTHSFVIKTGDGSGSEFVSNVDVTFDSSETNQTVVEKIRDAINQDKAIVTSAGKTAANSYSGGTSTFAIDINGTTTDVTVNGGGTYENLIDELVTNINDNVDGVTAEKVVDSPTTGQVQLKLSVDDSSNYISISHSSGFDLVTDLNIGVTQEKGASGIVTASSFSPDVSTTQLSISSRETGVDYRITDLADSGASTALSTLNLNLGTARTTFDQSLSPNTAGFVYSDITSSGNKLNSKFSFNGLDIQKSSNTFDDLVDGVTFNLKSITEAGSNDTNISVDVDSESIKTDLKDFVDKFNSLYTYLKQKQVSTKETRGILIGDSNAQSLLYSLQNSAVNNVPGINTGNLQYLSQIGISFDSTNGLSISDENLLSQKIKGSRSEVEALFNSTSGIAKTLYNSFENYIGAAGYLTNSINSISDNINYINDRIDTVQTRIDNRTEALRNQYFKLQTQLASLINSQNFFSSGISNIFG